MPRPVKKGPTGPFRRRIAAIKKAAKKVSKGPAPLPSPRPIKGKGGKVGKPTLMPKGPAPLPSPRPIKGKGGKVGKPTLMPVGSKPQKPRPLRPGERYQPGIPKGSPKGTIGVVGGRPVTSPKRGRKPIRKR